MERATTDTPLPQFEVRDACVYQVDGLCSVHPIRPFGCRVYFCAPTSTDWQNDLYERSLERVRAIHEQHGLPYRYMEWRAGLVEAGACMGDGLIAKTPSRQDAKGGHGRV